MAQGLPVFPSFDVHSSGIDTRWKKWCNRLENLLVGMAITDKKRKRALLLHYAGENVNPLGILAVCESYRIFGEQESDLGLLLELAVERHLVVERQFLAQSNPAILESFQQS